MIPVTMFGHNECECHGALRHHLPIRHRQRVRSLELPCAIVCPMLLPIYPLQEKSWKSSSNPNLQMTSNNGLAGLVKLALLNDSWQNMVGAKAKVSEPRARASSILFMPKQMFGRKSQMHKVVALLLPPVRVRF